jgi:adenylate cyclase
MISADETGTLAALRDMWATLFNPTVAKYSGRIVKMMGDGALVEFASAVDAVECALAIQSAMVAHNAVREGLTPVELRMGVNLGDIVIEGDDIVGDGVNVAARLEAQAPRTGILISDCQRRSKNQPFAGAITGQPGFCGMLPARGAAASHPRPQEAGG